VDVGLSGVVSILLTYLNAIRLLVFCTCVIILQPEIEFRVLRRVTYFCRVFVNAVFGVRYNYA